MHLRHTLGVCKAVRTIFRRLDPSRFYSTYIFFHHTMERHYGGGDATAAAAASSASFQHYSKTKGTTAATLCLDDAEEQRRHPTTKGHDINIDIHIHKKKTPLDDDDSQKSSNINKNNAKLPSLLFLLTNVVCWYGSNGLYGIAMQSFAADLRSSTPSSSSSSSPYSNMLLVSLTVTALQLLAGGLLGGVVGWALRTMTRVVVPEPETKTGPKTLVTAAHAQSSITTTSAAASSSNNSISTCTDAINGGDALPTSTKTSSSQLRLSIQQSLQLLPPSPEELQLALLHALGSVATNLGFLYGSASLVQIVKLLGA